MIKLNFNFLECGGVLQSDSGMIHYPESNTTQTYENNLNCGWTIKVNSSLVVNMTFIWIDIEKSAKCSLDYVEVKVYISLLFMVFAYFSRLDF